MNADTQIFNETHQTLHEQYLASAVPETKRPTVMMTTTTTTNNNHDNAGNDSSSHNKEETGKETFMNYRFVMSSFELYETKTRYYLIGTNQSKQRYRVLQIHRDNPKELVVIEDDVMYSEAEKAKLLKMIEDGNLSVGGLHRVPLNIYGIVGFIRFTQGWYMIFITERKQVALLGGHYIYHIEKTQLIPVGHQAKVDKKSDEARYMATFQNIDLTKNFYFSYTYDITNTLQVNMSRPPPLSVRQNDMFVWNHYLLRSGFKDLNSHSGWILPLIYGFVDQAKISIFGRNIVITLIARRSRHFAGARFLKRGVNDMGYVANDVETEQIVAEMTTTSFHSTDRLFGNPRYTSYVQHRGSIPLIWTQESTNMTPKPPIELSVVDPFYSAAALHFENLFQRYGTPCIVLNLIKKKETHKRESILGKEFEEAINYLNQFLPEDKRIRYIAWDMSRAAKSNDQDVIDFLENIAQEIIAATGFFHSGPEPYVNVLRRDGGDLSKRRMGTRQNGVLRTNCIDCLDRTNAAQFLMAKCALAHQLYALGVIASPKVEFDSDIVNIFLEMFHDHGDTIALQYGGSHLVNTMETYRKINQWTSHPRDMIETIKRFYANAFSDADKQDAINLFLGNFVTEDGQPMLWELNSDYHLHNQDPRTRTRRKDYRKWYSPEVLSPKVGLEDPSLYRITEDMRTTRTSQPDESDPFQGYWSEYYDPHNLTSLNQLFAYNMNGTLKYRPSKIAATGISENRELTKEEAMEISPFTVRPSSGSSSSSSSSSRQPATNKTALIEAARKKKLAFEEEVQENDLGLSIDPPPWSVEGIVKRNMNPSVSYSEQKEYKRYTQQFKSVERLAAVDQPIVNPDLYPEYVNYVRRQSDPDSSLRTQPMDEQLFKTYVDIPRQLGAIRQWSSDNAKRRYEGYATYLREGHYPQSHLYPPAAATAVKTATTTADVGNPTVTVQQQQQQQQRQYQQRWIQQTTNINAFIADAAAAVLGTSSSSKVNNNNNNNNNQNLTAPV